jgi:hypothetical protein
MRARFVVSLAATALLGLSCIERPVSPQARPILADRERAGDALLSTAPTPRHPVGAIFDNIELLGYDVSPEPMTRGGRARVTVYYRATEDIQDDWQVFVHMEDQARVLTRFNVDHFPANGRLHTNSWKKGDVVKDEFSFTFPTGTSALEIWTGFYQEEARLPLTFVGRGQSDGSNRLKAGVLTAQ